jgi:CRP/FNR family cyclic AMP-dependent transcriptional regulator
LGNSFDEADLEKLSQVPMFRNLSAAHRQKLLRHATVRKYRRNTILMERGDDANGLYVVLSGLVKVYLSDAQGREYVLGELAPGNYLGELALIEDSTRTASAMTLADSRLLFISKAVFKTFIHECPDAAYRLIRSLAARARELTEEVEKLALRDVYGRLAETLQSRAAEENGRLITDRLTQQQLASMVGASREMVSRIFKDLKSGGYISLEGKRIVLHRALPERW